MRVRLSRCRSHRCQRKSLARRSARRRARLPPTANGAGLPRGSASVHVERQLHGQKGGEEERSPGPMRACHKRSTRGKRGQPNTEGVPGSSLLPSPVSKLRSSACRASCRTRRARLRLRLHGLHRRRESSTGAWQGTEKQERGREGMRSSGTAHLGCGGFHTTRARLRGGTPLGALDI